MPRMSGKKLHRVLEKAKSYQVAEKVRSLRKATFSPESIQSEGQLGSRLSEDQAGHSDINTVDPGASASELTSFDPPSQLLTSGKLVCGRALRSKNGEIYDTVTRIGRGCFGEILLATKRSTQEQCAVKQIIYQNEDEREIEILTTLKTPGNKNIVEMYDELDVSELSSVGVCRGYAMELCDGDLKWLHTRGSAIKLSENVCLRLSVQLFSAVEYIHSRGIAHLDIKLDNCMLSFETSNLKLADFGCSYRVTAADSKTRPGYFRELQSNDVLACAYGVIAILCLRRKYLRGAEMQIIENYLDSHEYEPGVRESAEEQFLLENLCERRKIRWESRFQQNDELQRLVLKLYNMNWNRPARGKKSGNGIVIQKGFRAALTPCFCIGRLEFGTAQAVHKLLNALMEDDQQSQDEYKDFFKNLHELKIKSARN